MVYNDIRKEILIKVIDSFFYNNAGEYLNIEIVPCWLIKFLSEACHG
jgi:hypothetical protein